MEDSSNLNLGFAFNDEVFSDGTLLIELIPDDTVPSHNPKRRRIDSNDDDHEAVQGSGNQSSIENMTKQNKTIHIISAVLAVNSPFFYKAIVLKWDGESKQLPVTLQIQESEEAAFMDMLKFMYNNTLSSTTPSALLDVLMVADKYEVELCMKHCFQLLHKLPMTFESALLFLDLPSNILTAAKLADMVQSLVNVAKEFLVARLNSISKVQKEEEMLSLPLAGVEAVLSRDDLLVDSEDEIYVFVMKWAQKHYTNLSERQEILNTRLLCLIRFEFMSCQKLTELLNCTDIDFECSSELVIGALSFQTPLPQLPLSSQKERAYIFLPVKVTRSNLPREECAVYLNIKRDKCGCFNSNGIFSQPFYFGGRVFNLAMKYFLNEQSSVRGFGFWLVVQRGEGLGVECELCWRKKPSEEFVGMKKIQHYFQQSDARGQRNLFGVH